MSFTRCRYLRDMTCSVTSEVCLYWANTEFQERCEKSVLTAIDTYFKSGELVELCRNGQCSLTGQDCCFRKDAALRGNCRDRIHRVWELCKEIADTRKAATPPTRKHALK